MQILNELYAFEFLQGDIFPSNFKLDKIGQLYCPRELREAMPVSETCIYNNMTMVNSKHFGTSIFLESFA